jgi:enoyl-CoA hydratase/carnithine racemase
MLLKRTLFHRSRFCFRSRVLWLSSPFRPFMLQNASKHSRTLKKLISDAALGIPRQPRLHIPPHLLNVPDISFEPQYPFRKYDWENPEIVSEAPTPGTGGGRCMDLAVNRPCVYNAMDTRILTILKSLMKRYEENHAIHTIFLRGTGADFSTGTDLVALYNAGRTSNRTLQFQYTQELLQLVYYMATMSKPVFGVMNGRTLGVGAALTQSCLLKIATDTTEWAVPGTAFGYFPEGGLLYWLSHFGRDPSPNPARSGLPPALSQAVGLYLALTGKRVESSDLVHLGLATHFMTFEQIRWLQTQLGSLVHGDIRSILKVVHLFEFGSPYPFRLGEYLPIIERCFGQTKSVQEIFAALEAEQSEWAQRVLQRLKRLSPLSLLVTFRAFEHAKGLDLLQCLHMEHHIALRFFESADFYEGIEAAVIQKREPKWQYACIDDVPQSVVDSFFNLELAMSRAARDAASNISSDALFVPSGQTSSPSASGSVKVVSSNNSPLSADAQDQRTSTTHMSSSASSVSSSSPTSPPPTQLETRLPDLVLIPAYPIDPWTHQRITDRRPDVREEEDELYAQDPLREFDQYVKDWGNANAEQLRTVFRKVLGRTPAATQELERALELYYERQKNILKDATLKNMSLYPSVTSESTFVDPPNPLNCIRDEPRDPSPYPYKYVLRKKSSTPQSSVKPKTTEDRPTHSTQQNTNG